MPWYWILILILGFGYGVFLLALGGREGAKAVQEKKSLQHLEAPTHSLFHVSSAPVKENPLTLITPSPTEPEEGKEETTK